MCLENLVVTQLVNKLAAFMEPEGSQNPVTGSYPEPAETSLHSHMQFFQRITLDYTPSPKYHITFMFPNKFCMHSQELHPCYMPHSSSI
jgi:hypothetical protein